MATSPLVNFLIAGVQKGGTTALFDYLGEAPDICLSREKEPHFFDDERQDWSAPDYGAYHAAFPAPDGRPRGEATPIYTYWPNALERARAYNPALRLIILLRDPVARAWSHWRMETARGAETEPFGWCIRAGRQRAFGGEPWGYHREFSYVERGFYGEQIARVLALFPREQVLILRSEDLQRDPGPAWAAVRRLLGLPVTPAPAPRDVHVGEDLGVSLAADDASYLRAVYARDQLRLQALTGMCFS